MIKEDVEKILIKSFDYFKWILGPYVDIGELKRLSDWIVENINDEVEFENEINRYYVLSNHQISELVSHGKCQFKDINGNTINLRFKEKSDMPSILESGTLLVWNRDECNNSSEPKSPYQSAIFDGEEIIIHEPKTKTLVDFNKNLKDVQSLINMCEKLDWKKQKKMLEKIRREISREQVYYTFLENKQRTLSDYDN